jgi:hypothetical protein
MALVVSENCESIISKSTLLEVSFVAIPSNNNALVDAISAKAIFLHPDTLKRFNIKEDVKPTTALEAPAVEPVKPVEPAVEPVKPAVEPVKPVEPVAKPVEPAVEPVKPVVEPVAKPVEPVKPVEEPLKIEYIEVIREGALDVVNEAKALINVSKGKLV